jgi:hypothetical protein
MAKQPKPTNPIGVTFEKLRALLFALPGVEEGTCWGTPAYRVRNRLLARLHEDGETLVLKCADREALIEADPKVFYVTRHYQNYPWVLVRLAQAREASLGELIEQAWRGAASAKQIKLFESGGYVAPPLGQAPVAPPKPKAADDEQLARARRICLALPEAEEKEAWGAPTFRVKGRMFAMYVNNHHGDGRVALWLNAPPGVQAMLAEAAPEKFFIPPYQGKAGWIGVHLERNDEAELAFHVRQAYCVVAPKKLQELLPTTIAI